MDVKGVKCEFTQIIAKFTSTIFTISKIMTIFVLD